MVTGAAGVLGRQIVQTLRSADRKVFSCGRVSGEHVDLAWDLSQSDASKPDCSPDVVVHAAAKVGGYQQASSAADSLFDVNVTGTLRVVDWCIEQRVKRLVLISGAIVYGEWTGAPKSEEDPVKPWVAGPYAVSKWCSEQVGWLLAGSNVELTILRLSSLYGIGYNRGLVQRFIEEAMTKGSISLTPPLDDAFDLLHASDAARTVGRAVVSDETGTWNVGSGSLVRIQQLAEACAEKMDAHVSLNPGNPARTARVINWVNDEKSRKKLGHSCDVSLDAGIAEIAQSIRSLKIANAD